MHVTFDSYNFEEAVWMQANIKAELAMNRNSKQIATP